MGLNVVYPISPRLSPDGTHYICDHCGRTWGPNETSNCKECKSALEKMYVEGVISSFTKEKPLVVNSHMYRALEKLGVVPNEKVILQVEVPVE